MQPTDPTKVLLHDVYFLSTFHRISSPNFAAFYRNSITSITSSGSHIRPKALPPYEEGAAVRIV